MNSTHYVGLDVHKKTISYCLRQADGTIVQEGTIASTRQALTDLLECFPEPFCANFGRLALIVANTSCANAFPVSSELV